jgi:hypothetical protein
MLKQHDETKRQQDEQPEPKNAPQKDHLKKQRLRIVASTPAKSDASCKR